MRARGPRCGGRRCRARSGGRGCDGTRPIVAARPVSSQPSTRRCNITFNSCVRLDREPPWTSATPPPSPASTTSTRRGVYGAALRILGDPAPRAGRRAGRVPARLAQPRAGSTPAAASSARTCGSWPAAARSTSGARARPPAAPATASRSSSRSDERARRRPPADASPSATRTARAVRAALARLPAAQREALVLAYWGGLTADEIARRSGVPLGTAKSRIRLGLAKLRAEIEGSSEPARSPRPPDAVASVPGRAAPRHAPYDEIVRPLFDAARAALPAGTRVVRRAHAHRPQRPRRVRGRPGGDPRRRSTTPASSARCSSRCTSPAATARPTTRCSRRARRPAGRLVAARARRARAPRTRWPRRGAASTRARAGIKLHPRSDDFGLPHPAVERGRRAVDERGARRCSSTPAAGSRTSARRSSSWPRRTRGARLILAHAGISDLGLDRAGAPPSCRTSSSTPRGGRSPTCSRCSRPSRRARSSTPATCPTAAALFHGVRVPALRAGGRARRRRAGGDRGRVARARARGRGRRSTSARRPGTARARRRATSGFERVVDLPRRSPCNLAFRGVRPDRAAGAGAPRLPARRRPPGRRGGRRADRPRLERSAAERRRRRRPMFGALAAQIAVRARPRSHCGPCAVTRSQ